jgi:UDP-N-acetylmuramoyl-tripeptide--D-alanyl-D-alanine ligase
VTVFPWTARDVAAALAMPPLSWDHSYAGISTDTRRLSEGELFVALKGDKFDGHDFLSDARTAAVGGVVVRRDTPRWPGFDWFEVGDTREALGKLARYRRDRMTGPVVAITGTTGKTSTKELLAAALGVKYCVHKSEGNLNNLVGVPLSLLAMPVEAEAAVIECGASLPGEIARLREIARPDLAVITNVGAGHLEGFGDVAGVMAEKIALVTGVATAVVGTEPAELPEAARRAAERVITAGLGSSADWRADEVEVTGEGRARFVTRGVEVELPFHGRHMVPNALVALAVSHELGVRLEEAAAALRNAALPAGRSAVREVGGVTIVDDCYNANPASLEAALALLADVRGGRRTVTVLGTMRELGERSRELHREMAAKVLEAKPDVIAAVGEFVPAFRELEPGLDRDRLLTADTPEELAPLLREALEPGDVVLFKASRGVALERLYPLLWPEASHAGAH